MKQFFNKHKSNTSSKQQMKTQNVKVGSVVHSNDKYFLGSDGYSKDRESVVVAKNGENVALVKLTTSENPKYMDVPNYPKHSRFMTEDIYVKDNEGKPIVVSKQNSINDLHKFIVSHFPNLPKSSVDEILNIVLNNSKYGERNTRRYNEFNKKRE